MPKLIRAPLRDVRSRCFDSTRWAGFEVRADDIVIATYPKCGTTWTQRIVGMLVFGSAEPFGIPDVSPWPDFRATPFEMTVEVAQNQQHRRFLKSHVSYDSLPIYEGVKFIHVARDGRDSAMSFHNHKLNYAEETLARMDEISLADPKFGTPLPRVEADPAKHFHDWVAGSEDHLGDESGGFFHMENSYWAERDNPNVLLVHYADMKKDLGGEMRRIAKFLDIEIDEALWPSLIEAASFDSMKNNAEVLMPNANRAWKGGGNTFLHKGINGRWQGLFEKKDLDAYDVKVKKHFTPELAQWLEHGRLGA